jgi:hypothetical protein
LLFRIIAVESAVLYEIKEPSPTCVGIIDERLGPSLLRVSISMALVFNVRRSETIFLNSENSSGSLTSWQDASFLVSYHRKTLCNDICIV